MSKKIFNASLVGIQFQKPPINVHTAIKSTSIILKREPSNPHDKNAVAVILSGYKVGYINKECVADISLLLYKGATYEVSTKEFSTNAKSIGLNISFTLDNGLPESPIIAPKNTSGIYRISILNRSGVYIGQSNDVNKRLLSHWKDLAFNSHINRPMQELWNNHGPNAFTAELVDSIVNEISALEKQRWLAEKEQLWIEKERQIGNCLNITDGEIIPTNKAVAEYEIEEKRRIKSFDADVKEKKKKLKEEIGLAEVESIKIRSQLIEHENKVKELDTFIRKNTGIRGYFSSSYVSKTELIKKQGQLDEALKQMYLYRDLSSKASEKFSQLKKQHRGLKTNKQLEGLTNSTLIRFGVNPYKNKPKIK